MDAYVYAEANDCESGTNHVVESSHTCRPDVSDTKAESSRGNARLAVLLVGQFRVAANAANCGKHCEYMTAGESGDQRQQIKITGFSVNLHTGHACRAQAPAWVHICSVYVLDNTGHSGVARCKSLWDFRDVSSLLAGEGAPAQAAS